MRPSTLATALTLALALSLAAQTTPAQTTPAQTPAAQTPAATDHYVPKSATGTSTPTQAPTAKAPLITPPYSQNPIQELQGNARALLVFAPDTSNPGLRKQMQLLSGHDLELSKLNTVFVPLVTLAHANEVIFGENLHPGNYRDQLSARRKFGIKYNQFVVILLDKDGNEKFRSMTPVTMADLSTAIDTTTGGTAGGIQ
jgi:hypothetical protein